MLISTCNKAVYQCVGREKSFEIYKKAGYDGLDYNPTCFMYSFTGGIYHGSAKDFEEYFTTDARLAKEAGLKICQVHAPFPTFNDSKEKFDDMAEAIRKSIIAAAMLESKILVIHAAMPFGWKADTDHALSRKVNFEVYSKLLPTAHEYGVTIALENMNMQVCTTGNIEQHLDYIDMMDDDLFKGCFDTGHANMSGYVCGEYVEKMGNRLCAIHVHDNNGRNDLHEPMYYGSIDWDRFAVGLKAIGFNGAFSLESDHYHIHDEEAQLAFEKAQYASANYLVTKAG